MDKTVLIRKTSYGSIEGSYMQHTDTIRWLGVPYAAPPVGGLRWRAPAGHKGWTGIRPANFFAPESVQMGKEGVFGSEDCLYLNIYRPAGAEEPLPIFFFIHGGNNQTDSGRMLDGDSMAQGLNAVVVTVNLRLNSLGWLTLPSLKTGNPLEDSGNYGLLDILAALDWIRANAGVFGGSLENITACGYSSGARDLLCMLISPLFKDKFARAVTFSGGFTTTQPAFGMHTAARAIAPLAVEDKMASNEEAAYEWLLTPGNDVREWLCSVSAERFGPLMAGAAIRMRVFPHLFADGTVIPEEGFEVLKEGKCINVPMLCLSGGHEFDFPLNNDPLFKNADFSDHSVMEEYKFATKYGGLLFGYFNAEQNAECFSCVEGHAPVYAGRCLWGMDPKVTDEYAAMRMGGTHGLDLYLVMGTERVDYGLTENVWNRKNLAGRKALRQIYLGYLRQFIRTGNPNQNGLPLWKPWTGSGSLMLFDADCEHAAVRLSESKHSSAGIRGCASDEDIHSAAEMSICIVNESKVLEMLLNDRSLPEPRKEFILKHVLSGRFFSKHLDLFTQKYYP